MGIARFDGGKGLSVSAEMLQTWQRDGVLVIENAVTSDGCRKLIDQMQQIVSDADVGDGHSVFDTISREQENDDYFLGSGNDIRFFLEAGAAGEDGKLQVPVDRALNKVGHALHTMDPVFTEFCRRQDFVELLKELGMQQPDALQSMYIFKQPRIGGEVVCHQDSTFLWTSPQSCIGLWFALEDATLENGCLWGIAGEHNEDAPRQRFRRTAAGAMTTSMDVLDDRVWSVDEAEPLEVPAGTMIVLHGQFPHLSGPNTSDKPRDAFALHFVDGASEYPADNWLER